MHTRIGASNRALRGFARDPSRSKEFPDSAAFYESDTFLDSPISNAVRLRGEADGDFEPPQPVRDTVLRVLLRPSRQAVAAVRAAARRRSAQPPQSGSIDFADPRLCFERPCGGRRYSFCCWQRPPWPSRSCWQTASLDGGWSVGSSRRASIPATSCRPSNNRDATRAPMKPAHPVSRILNRVQSSLVPC